MSFGRSMKQEEPQKKSETLDDKLNTIIGLLRAIVANTVPTITWQPFQPNVGDPFEPVIGDGPLVGDGPSFKPFIGPIDSNICKCNNDICHNITLGED